MDKGFEIISFQMDKEIADNHRRAGVIYSPDEFLLERLRSLAYFFESNGLTTRKILDSKNEISKQFILKSTDLTENGMKVFRKGYKGWMTNSKKRLPSDVVAFEKAFNLLKKGKIIHE